MAACLSFCTVDKGAVRSYQTFCGQSVESHEIYKRMLKTYTVAGFGEPRVYKG